MTHHRRPEYEEWRDERRRVAAHRRRAPLRSWVTLFLAAALLVGLLLVVRLAG